MLALLLFIGKYITHAICLMNTSTGTIEQKHNTTDGVSQTNEVSGVFKVTREINHFSILFY